MTDEHFSVFAVSFFDRQQSTREDRPRELQRLPVFDGDISSMTGFAIHLDVDFAGGFNGGGGGRRTTDYEVGFLRELDRRLHLDVEPVATGIGHSHRLTHLRTTQTAAN